MAGPDDSAGESSLTGTAVAAAGARRLCNCKMAYGVGFKKLMENNVDFSPG
jgi:hypothetical protein